jgi:hypothetical protein
MQAFEVLQELRERLIRSGIVRHVIVLREHPGKYPQVVYPPNLIGDMSTHPGGRQSDKQLKIVYLRRRTLIV